MTIIRLSRTSAPLVKGALDVAHSQSELPRTWSSATYAPGYPIQPFTNPEEVEVPREIDYPIAVNASLQPRTGYGLMPFSALAAAYENVAEVRMPVQIIMRELQGFHPRLVDVKGNELTQHPYRWLTITPDRHAPFDVWLTRFLKSTYIFDAGAVYIDYDDSTLNALSYIDGSTLFIIIDEHGGVPTPTTRSNDPAVIEKYLRKATEWANAGKPLPTKTPAYAQVIKGTPFGWYSQDEIWYKPRSRRFNAPYGESFIEQSWAWVLVIANITAFELAHYREGNMPEGWFESPPDWSLDRLAAFELVNNARMSAGPAERMRSRFYPNGFKWHETKKAEFPQKLYEQARDNILNVIGLPPSEVGKVPGQGLGGRGFSEAMQSALFRNALMPPKIYVEGLFNELMRRFGIDDAVFELSLPIESVDPDKQRLGVISAFQSGLLTMNDALGQLGLTKVPGGDIHIIIQGGTVIVLEDYLQGKRDPVPAPGGDGQQPVETTPTATFSPEDTKLAETILESGAIPTNGSQQTFSDMAKQDLVHPHGVKGKFAPKGKVDANGIRALLSDMGVADSTVLGPSDVDQLLAEYEQEEAEHPTLAADPHNIMQIVLDHRRKSVEKRDITSHDGAMVACFLPDDVAQKLRAIADGLMLPDEAEMERAENMHVTLAFLPDVTKTKGFSDETLRMCKGLASTYGPLKCKVQGYGVFNGADGKRVLYASLDNPDLPRVRESVCQVLEACNVPYAKDHGFEPHITLAYIPEKYELPEGFAVPDMECEITKLCLAIGETRYDIPFAAGQTVSPTTPTTGDHVPPDLSGYTKQRPAGDIPKLELPGLNKLSWADLRKHCGVCPEDDEYYQAPVTREVNFQFPSDHHINDVEIVAMTPNGLPPKPALWKPEGGELESVWPRIGGKQYPREEAAYLLDRSFGFELVPVAYVATVDDEEGAVCYYTAGAGDPKPTTAYGREWVERAAVLDYTMSQLDRHEGHNYFTHPDDEMRMILFDNGLSFPTMMDAYCESNFCSAMYGKPLSDAILKQMMLTYTDLATWADIRKLVGPDATDKARLCLQHMIADKAILPIHTPVTVSGTTTS